VQNWPRDEICGGVWWGCPGKDNWVQPLALFFLAGLILVFLLVPIGLFSLLSWVVGITVPLYYFSLIFPVLRDVHCNEAAVLMTHFFLEIIRNIRIHLISFLPVLYPARPPHYPCFSHCFCNQLRHLAGPPLPFGGVHPPGFRIVSSKTATCSVLSPGVGFKSTFLLYRTFFIFPFSFDSFSVSVLTPAAACAPGSVFVFATSRTREPGHHGLVGPIFWVGLATRANRQPPPYELPQRGFEIRPLLPIRC